jgi:hypothetical protein
LTRPLAFVGLVPTIQDENYFKVADGERRLDSNSRAAARKRATKRAARRPPRFARRLLLGQFE